MLMKKRTWHFQDWPVTELPGPKSYYLAKSNAPAELPAYNWHLVGMVLTLLGIWPSLTGNNTVQKLAFLPAQAESKLVCFVWLSWCLRRAWTECFKIGHTHLGLPQALYFLLCNICLASPLHVYATHLLPQASDLWSRSDGALCGVFS